MRHIRLLREFAKNPLELGVIFPSSNRLAKAITADIGLETAVAVAEIGPGTAVFTSHILKMIPSKTKYFAVEINPSMYELFIEKFPGVRIYNADAVHMKKMLTREKIKNVDVVISGLPWSLFTLKLQCKIMKAISDALPVGGHFATYAYLQGTMMPGGTRFKKLLDRYFSSVTKSKTIWNNIPPAFVYRCVK